MKNIYLIYLILIATVFINVSCARETGEIKNMKGVIYYSNGKNFILKDLRTEESKKVIDFRKAEIDYQYPMWFKKVQNFGFFRMTKNEGYVCFYDTNGKFIKKISGFHGSYPSLSPDENQVAYYRHKNLSVVKNIKDDSEKIFKDFCDYVSPIWIDNDKLVYLDTSKSIMLLDLKSKEKEDLGNNNLIPLSKYCEDSVLCVGHDSKKLYLFNVNTGENKQIYAFERRLWGYNMILSPDKNFIVVSELKPGIFNALAEKSDINIISLKDGNKKLIQENAILDGGFWFEK